MAIWSDFKYGARLLVKDRGVSAAAVCALGLALAATNTIFTLANGIFLKPLPFDEPDRVVLLRTERQVAAAAFPFATIVVRSEAGTAAVAGALRIQ